MPLIVEGPHPTAQRPPDQTNDDNNSNVVVEILDSDDENSQHGDTTTSGTSEIKGEPNVKTKLDVAAAHFPITTFHLNNTAVDLDSNSDENNDEVSVVVPSPACKKKAQKIGKSHAKKQLFGEKSKRFSCDICGYACASRSHLKQHQHIHMGHAGKRFKCDICGFAAVHKGNLNQHMLTHSGRKQHQCDKCNKLFTRCRTLKRHQATHENKKLQ